MKPANFDIATEAVRGGEVDLKPAEKVISTIQHLRRTPGVLGIWAGARASEPYVMLAINGERSRRLSRMIPDSIGGVNIYYVEGNLR